MKKIEYTSPEVNVIVFDIDDVRMEQTVLSKTKVDRNMVGAGDVPVGFWDDGGI